jgi:hypothetical protein
MIYLASPYSHMDRTVEALRFGEVCRIAGVLMSRGLIVFSPIAHTHPIAERCDLPRGWDYWKHFDEEFIDASEKVIVAMMPGWEQSKGIAGEIRIAKEKGIPVEYLDPNKP